MEKRKIWRKTLKAPRRCMKRACRADWYERSYIRPLITRHPISLRWTSIPKSSVGSTASTTTTTHFLMSPGGFMRAVDCNNTVSHHIPLFLQHKFSLNPSLFRSLFVFLLLYLHLKISQSPVAVPETPASLGYSHREWLLDMTFRFRIRQTLKSGKCQTGSRISTSI